MKLALKVIERMKSGWAQRALKQKIFMNIAKEVHGCLRAKSLKEVTSFLAELGYNDLSHMPANPVGNVAASCRSRGI